MKQRVAIARALAFDPRVLLMDEPFAALDAQTRESLQDELLRIWRATGKTIVFITHGIDEAVYLGQRVAVMSPRPGRISDLIDIDLDPVPGEDVRSDPRSAACGTTSGRPCSQTTIDRSRPGGRPCLARRSRSPSLDPAPEDYRRRAGLTVDDAATGPAAAAARPGPAGQRRDPRCSPPSGRSPRGSGWSTRCSCRRSARRWGRSRTWWPAGS